MTKQNYQELTDLWMNFAVVRCGNNKISIQKHSKIDYMKSPLADVIDNHVNGGKTSVLCGARSNNLEIMDFDLHNAEDPVKFMEDFTSLVREQLGEEFLKKMTIQLTPSGGQHWMYRTSKVDGNKKISKGVNKEAIVESRGEGGYFVCYPSEGYELIQGEMATIPVITAAEKDILWLSAKMLEEAVEPAPMARAKPTPPVYGALSNESRQYNDDSNVWKEFDTKCDFLRMLEQDGWWIPRNGEKGNGKYLLVRPDKTDESWSADLDLHSQEVPLLYLYSSSTKLASEKAYNASSYLIQYRFDGDTIRAYDYLIDNGYAPPRKEKAQAQGSTKEILELGKDEKPKDQKDATGIFSKYMDYKVDDTTEVVRPVPIIKINDVGCLHTGELMTLSGESKAGKSALLSAIIAKVLNPNAQGFPIIHTEKTEYPILHFDTEQPIHRHKDNQQHHIMKRAGLTEYPKQLMSYNLRRLSVEERKLMIQELVESARIEFGGVFMVIIDGLADFIQDTNDIKQSAAIVSWVLEMSSEYNCGVIVVIHLNPTPEGGFVKQRGHLGSELQRKTDTLLTVQKEPTSNKEESVLKAHYLRNGGIHAFGEHRIFYDDKTKMHQLSEGEVEGQDEFRENTKYLNLSRRIAGMSLKDASRQLVEVGECKSLPIAKKAINELIEFEYMIKSAEGILMSKGNLTAPKLIPLDEAENMRPDGLPAPF